MKKTLDENTVRHVAELARLRLTDEEVHRFRDQLTSILGYFEQLEELDTQGVPPFVHPLDVHNVLRPDEPQPSWSPEDALANAPHRQGDFFRVPKVLGQDGA